MSRRCSKMLILQLVEKESIMKKGNMKFSVEEGRSEA
jgi:hypothetical protein